MNVRKLDAWGLLLADMLIVAVTPWVAMFVRFEGNIDNYYNDALVMYIAFSLVISLMVFCLFGLYRRLWRYAGADGLVAISGAVVASGVIAAGVMYAGDWILPRSVYVMSIFFNISCIGGGRLLIRYIHFAGQREEERRTKVLIYGAGDAGAVIAREMTQRYYQSKELVGFIDDNPGKQNQILFGTKVMGTRQDLLPIVRNHQVNEIIIAITSLEGNLLRDIVYSCKQTPCAVKIVPSIHELIDGKVSVPQVRNVELDDLLRREPVKLDLGQIAEYVKGKRVLVTGAGGSIGSELCRQIALLGPAKLVMLGRGENSIYEINGELKDRYPDLSLQPVIADIKDWERVRTVFGRHRPQVVFHAAAHKHVPLMEAQPEEAVRNNVFGTRNIAEAAKGFRAEIFVMISTDKAVNPTSVMGASKRVAELIVQNMNDDSSQTKFMAVRFGNVLGSRGSIVPLFKKQIAMGGPVTITHPDMERYFMTIPEAVQLVMQAGALGKGGEVFVLDMGKPVKILEMACDLIRLSGFVPYHDIQIEFTGLRPGEKITEELWTADEGIGATKHEKIFIANLRHPEEWKLQEILSGLGQTQNPKVIIQLLGELIPTYHRYLQERQEGLEKKSSEEEMEKAIVEALNGA